MRYSQRFRQPEMMRATSPAASPRAAGFSMLESLVAVGVTAIAGTALLTAAVSAVQAGHNLTQVAVAQGIARQLMDEISATRFPSSSSSTASGGASNRAAFDDLDDYAGWTSRPPVDRLGNALGTEGTVVAGSTLQRPYAMRADSNTLGGYAQSVIVERVQPNASNDWSVTTQSSNFRRVTVIVTYTDARGSTATLATEVRVFAAVPIGP